VHVKTLQWNAQDELERCKKTVIGQLTLNWPHVAWGFDEWTISGHGQEFRALGLSSLGQFTLNWPHVSWGLDEWADYLWSGQEVKALGPSNLGQLTLNWPHVSWLLDEWTDYLWTWTRVQGPRAIQPRSVDAKLTSCRMRARRVNWHLWTWTRVQGPRAIQPSLQWTLRATFTADKATTNVNWSFLQVYEVKNEWSYSCIPSYAFMVRCVGTGTFSRSVQHSLPWLAAKKCQLYGTCCSEVTERSSMVGGDARLPFPLLNHYNWAQRRLYLTFWATEYWRRKYVRWLVGCGLDKWASVCRRERNFFLCHCVRDPPSLINSVGILWPWH
jgi:hypothetical protein